MGLFGCGIERVDCYYAVCLVWEEAGCVVGVDYDAAGEDLGVWGSKDGDLLILPGVEILRCCVTPVLVARYCCSRVVWIECEICGFYLARKDVLTLVVKMPCSIPVKETPIGVIHEIGRRREMDLWSPLTVVVTCSPISTYFVGGLDRTVEPTVTLSW